MKELRLSLKTKWFEMTGPNGKTEDYREVSPYWCNRLVLVDGETMPKKWWFKWFLKQEEYKNKGLMKVDLYLSKIVTNTKTGYNYEFKPFTSNTMTLGYPKSTDTSRIKKFEHAGIEIGYGKEEWGAEPNKLYFIIKHGKQL